MILTAAPKLRMLAGPNGSGKSTLFQHLRRQYSFPFGYCLNPDEIDHELAQASRLYLGAWGVRIDNEKLKHFVARHPLSKRLEGSLPKIDGSALVAPRGYQAGYFTSIFCDLLRRDWISNGESFTFETVMSHPDRPRQLAQARLGGYRTYLYYVCTNDVIINSARVANRAAQGGHNVPATVIEDRYRRSLALLPTAIRHSTRAYIFDNSGEEHRLIAEYLDSELDKITSDPPAWFVDAMLNNRQNRQRRS